MRPGPGSKDRRDRRPNGKITRPPVPEWEDSPRAHVSGVANRGGCNNRGSVQFSWYKHSVIDCEYYKYGWSRGGGTQAEACSGCRTRKLWKFPSTGVAHMEHNTCLGSASYLGNRFIVNSEERNGVYFGVVVLVYVVLIGVT